MPATGYGLRRLDVLGAGARGVANRSHSDHARAFECRKGFLVYREPIRLCLNEQGGVQQRKPLHDAEVIVVC
jgi:hypothetical protein